MDVLQAKEIVKSLADGVNPLTGEVISKYDVCNQVEIVRALYCILSELDKAEVKSKKNLPGNAGKPWTEPEDSMLETEFETGMKVSEMTKLHERSRGSIEARLAKLGLIDRSYFTGR